MRLNKLTLKNNISTETFEKLLKLKGEAMLLQANEAGLEHYPGTQRSYFETTWTQEGPLEKE